MMDVRDALRRELELRGFDVGEDTVASAAGFYVEGRDDLAAGTFAFRQTSDEAIETMYLGNWSEGLPPRFAVLPATAASESSFEMLEQMNIHPLLYHVDESGIAFVALDDTLARLSV